MVGGVNEPGDVDPVTGNAVNLLSLYDAVDRLIPVGTGTGTFVSFEAAMSCIRDTRHGRVVEPEALAAMEHLIAYTMPRAWSLVDSDEVESDENLRDLQEAAAQVHVFVQSLREWLDTPVQ
jgi:hypothetical protein